MDDVGLLLSEQSLAERLLVPEDIQAGYGVAVEDLYSIFMFEALHNIHLEKSRLFKTRVIQYSSSAETYSPPGASLEIRRE